MDNYNCDGLIIEVGKEYLYIDQSVKVIELIGNPPQCLVEARFAERTRCEPDELSERKKPWQNSD